MNINSSDELLKAITGLQQKNAYLKEDLNKSFDAKMESLQPLNLLKSAVRNIAEVPDLRKSITNASLGISAGLLAKKLIVGKSNSFSRKVIGKVAEFAAASLIIKKAPSFKETIVEGIDKIKN